MVVTGKYKRFNHLFLFTILLTVSVLINNAAYAETILYISKPDTITAGTQIAPGIQTYTSSAAVPVTVQKNNSIQINANTAIPESWSIEFAAPLKEQLQVTNYEDASLPDGYPGSANSPTKPALNVSIGGRQCKTVSGRFDVLKVNYDSKGVLVALAVDFVQQCDGNPSLLYGTIRHNTPTISPIRTKPIAIAGADQHVVEANIIDLKATPISFSGNVVKLNAANSSAGSGATITSYSWQQISGPTLKLSNTSSINPIFTIVPPIKLGGDELVFKLTITNSSGVSDTDQVTIFVASKSDPQTSFFFESDPADIIAHGATVYADIDDARFDSDNSGKQHAHITIDNGENWFADFGSDSNSADLFVSTTDYTNVKRHSLFKNNPVMYLYHLNSGCTFVTGTFLVSQLKRDASDKLTNLKINFTQECDTKNLPNQPSMRGYIKLNYVDTSVPIASAGIDQTVTEGTRVTLDASSSSDPGGSIAIDAYQWLQLDGDLVKLSKSTSAKPIFIAPTLSNALKMDLVFQVTITDSAKFKAKSSVTITVIPKAVVIPPVIPAQKSNSGVGGGGGGCSFYANAEFDGSFYFLLLLALLIRIYRNKSIM